jgi:hypothetical protein
MVQLKVRPEHLKGALDGRERRRYKRFEITLLGRYLRILTKEEFTCRLMDISVGGASLLCDTPPQIGEMVVVQFDEIGSLEGTVARAVPGGFAVEFSATHRRRQKLAAQITWLLNRHELAAADQRRPGHDRIALPPKPARVEIDADTVLERNLIDISISGASVEMDERPPIGSKIVLGRFPSTVVRHHARGIGVEFSYIQQFETIREDFG